MTVSAGVGMPAYRDRREGRQPLTLRCVPDGRGRRARNAVHRDFAADRRTAAAA
jgi:hypothetical protein